MIILIKKLIIFIKALILKFIIFNQILEPNLINYIFISIILAILLNFIYSYKYIYIKKKVNLYIKKSIKNFFNYKYKIK